MLEIPINVKTTIKKLADFIKKELKRTGKERVVVGLSGGIDSAVSAALAVKALGPKGVVGIMMPYKTSNPSSLEDATTLAKALKIESSEVPITSIVDSYFEGFPDVPQLRRGNFMARARMCVLYDQSEVHRAVVLGTSNRTEMLLGYGTVYGDSACAFNPLGSLYKTDLYKIAKELKIPNEIINKVPSADLWEGQSDEEELGLKYEEIDVLLYHMTELKYPDAYLETMGFTPEYIDNAKKRIDANSFKSNLPRVGKAVRK